MPSVKGVCVGGEGGGKDLERDEENVQILVKK